MQKREGRPFGLNYTGTTYNMLHILGYFYTVNEFWVVELILANVAYEITLVNLIHLIANLIHVLT